MALAITRNGTPLDVLYAPKGANKAADTGLKQNGVDVSNSILALADGQALGFNAGISKGGTDFSAIFGRPLGNTPLPINGNNYVEGYTVPAASTGYATIGFRITGGNTWQVFGASPSDPNHIWASGTVPAGAVNVKYTWGTPFVPGGGADANGGIVTNGASSPAAISGNPQTYYTTATFGSSAGSRSRSYPFTIDFYNGSGVDISTTNITLGGDVEGSV